MTRIYNLFKRSIYALYSLNLFIALMGIKGQPGKDNPSTRVSKLG